MDKSNGTEFASAERHNNQELRQQAGYFSNGFLPAQFLDAMPVGMVVLNQQRQVVYANEFLAQVVGAESALDVLGMRLGEIFGCIHSLEGPNGCGTTRSCRQCGSAHAILGALDGEKRVEECHILRTRDGREEALNLRVWTTPVEFNHEQFITLAVMDISHEKRRRALERTFFHDVLNLAGVLQWTAHLVPEATPNRLPELHAALQSTSFRLVEEIRAQKDLLAAETHELPVQPVEIPSAPFVEQIIEMYQLHPAAEGRTLCTDPGCADVVFVSDPVLLGRVIGNMVKNGLEASAEGDCIRVSCQPEREEIVFRVHSPAYMPEEVQVKVFHRSFSTKGAGRGLGTYSMKLLTEGYLRGKISFISTPQEGTTFIGRYPLTWEDPRTGEALAATDQSLEVACVSGPAVLARAG